MRGHLLVSFFASTRQLSRGSTVVFLSSLLGACVAIVRNVEFRSFETRHQDEVAGRTGGAQFEVVELARFSTCRSIQKKKKRSRRGCRTELAVQPFRRKSHEAGLDLSNDPCRPSLLARRPPSTQVPERVRCLGVYSTERADLSGSCLERERESDDGISLRRLRRFHSRGGFPVSEAPRVGEADSN